MVRDLVGVVIQGNIRQKKKQRQKQKQNDCSRKKVSVSSRASFIFFRVSYHGHFREHGHYRGQKHALHQ